MRSQLENHHTLQCQEWTSWTCFARDELGAPRAWVSSYNILMREIDNNPSVFEVLHGCRDLCKILMEKMDHESSVFGLPPIHMESETPPDSRSQTELKRRIVMEVIGGCLERIKIEALFKMEQRLEKEGLEGFRSILNGESIIEELAKVDVSSQSPGE
jgi:hypothetical protein